MLQFLRGGVIAQTPMIGAWKNRLDQAGSVVAFTDSALGIGVTQPEGKAEVFYCPSVQQDYPGLVLTRVQCAINAPPGSGTGMIPGGFNDVLPGSNPEGPTDPIAAIEPIHAYTSVTPVGFPLNQLRSNQQPLMWARIQTDATGIDPGKNDARFVVYPDGRSGINVADPRCALDVRGFGANTPAAIFGTNAQRVAVTIAGAPLPMRYTRHVEVVPHLGHQGYNTISRDKDLGIIFTDGMGNEGTNVAGALVIAPWNKDQNAGGLRMDANGNTELRGNLEVRGKLLCNGFVSKPRWWPDYVFEDNYRLLSLDSVASFIQYNRHLPGMPSHQQILKQGQDIGLIQQLQQEKIEELMLYVLQLNQELNELRRTVRNVSNQ